jgi:23S rRNA (adenine-N6)-dimethyltransferase
VMAVELDPVWADRLRRLVRRARHTCVEVFEGDFRSLRLPTRPFRVVGSIPFGGTTDILRHLLDEPRVPLKRADLIVQWEVARKRVASPPNTLLSTIWAPWWEFRLGRRIPAREFRPVPRVEAAVLIITPRQWPLLPPAMARSYGDFVRTHWPFQPESV